MKQSLIVLNLILAFHGSAHAARLVATSGQKQVQLIELYSSESCSSCPPADKWISTLKNTSGLWQSFVPVVFHVDYWNDLGWKDAFSSNAMTRRQQEVAKTWAHPTVYTPAVVIDGTEWRAWSNAPLPQGNKPSKIQLFVYQENDGRFEVVTKGLSSSAQYVLRIAKLGMNIKSNVTAGENSGNFLEHNFVVLDWDSRRISGNEIKTQFKLKLKPEDKKQNGKTAIAVWIEKTEKPIPLQATGGYL